MGSRQVSESRPSDAALFRQAFEGAPIGMAVCALDGRFVRGNPAFCRMLGYAEPELQGLTYPEITHPDDRLAGVALFARLARGEIPGFVREKRVVRKDGEILDVSLSVSLARGGDGQPLRLVAQIVDVTERRRAREALRRSEEQIRALFELAPDGIAVTDPEDRHVDVNAALCRILGRAREELIGLAVQDVLSPENLPAMAGVRAAVRVAGDIRTQELVIRRADGTRVPVEVNVTCLPDGRRVAFVRDIGERRRLTREREAALLQIQGVLDQCPVGLVLLTRQGDEITVQNNRRCREIMGQPDGVVRMGQWVPHIEQPDGRPVRLEEAPTVRAVRGEHVEPTELVVRRSDGARVPILIRGEPLLGPDGAVEGAVVAFDDISAQKDLERLRQEWTSVVVHDLQQPIAAIRLYAGLLDRVAARDAAARGPVDRIVEVATALGRRISDLLDLSRAEAGQLPLGRRPVDLADLAQAAVERAVPLAGDRPLDVQIRGEIPGLRADPDRILQVLESLLANAVQYGAPGTPIVVSVEPGDGEVAVAVTNEGRGIAPEDLPGLFRRFDRGKGTGLGLHLARELVLAHGGRLGAESVPGRTTTFRFTLPVET